MGGGGVGGEKNESYRKKQKVVERAQTSWHDCKAENEGKKRQVKKVGRTILSLSKYLIIQRKLQELSHPSKPNARETFRNFQL